MARLNVNPTRMELNRLKKRLTVARRGHGLLKDKRDELMKKFIVIVHETKSLREKMESLLASSHEDFLMARALMTAESLEEALMYPKSSVELNMRQNNIMSVRVPVYAIEEEQQSYTNIYPYGLLSTSAQLDDSIYHLTQVFPIMLQLAEKEKTMQLIAKEIEKTRRRVNALEYVMIPQLQETIQYITMKLEENERGNITRLMKVKDMMVQEEINKKQQARS